MRGSVWRAEGNAIVDERDSERSIKQEIRRAVRIGRKNDLQRFDFAQLPEKKNDRHYGMVQVNAALNHITTGRVLSPLEVGVVAQVCGLLLYSFEMSALIRTQREQLTGADIPARKPLTVREQAILRMMSDKCSNREIAETLQIEITTVRKHQQGIYRKLGVKSKHEALLVSYYN